MQPINFQLVKSDRPDSMLFVCNETGARFYVDVKSLDLTGRDLSFNSYGLEYGTNTDLIVLKRYMKEVVVNIVRDAVESYNPQGDLFKDNSNGS